jgi:hypothetical protein
MFCIDSVKSVFSVNSIDSVDKALHMHEKVSWNLRDKKYQKKVLWSVLEMSTLFTLCIHSLFRCVDTVNYFINKALLSMSTLSTGVLTRVARACLILHRARARCI